jgi:hypothetical protein
MTPTLVVLNGFIGERFPAGSLPPDLSPALRELARQHESRAQRSIDSMKRLETLGLRVIPVPRLYTPDFSRPAIEQVAQLIAGVVKP